MFTASYYFVASSGYYSGSACAKSPKAAMERAQAVAHAALCAGDVAAGVCSGIAAEGWRMHRGAVLVGRADLL